MSFEAFLIVAAILFSIGLYGSLARRNVLAVLMSIELMFNAVNVTLVAMAKYLAPAGLQEDLSTALTGQVFAVFIITVAAAGDRLGAGDSLRHVPHQRVGGPGRRDGDAELGMRDVECGIEVRNSSIPSS